jgi:hypothetical protein
MPILRLSIPLATPALVARCGCDVSTFVASISAEVALAGISQGVISPGIFG